jgi:hypothetical protein
MAFFLTLAIAALVLAMIVLLPLGAAVRDVALARRQTPVSAWAIWAFDLLRGGLALAAAFGVLGLIYHFGPCVKRAFRPVTPGAIFCMTVWVLLGLAFKEYVNRFSGSRYEQTYGAAGWVVIMLVIFYLDALVLLIGAEINSEIDFAILGVPRGSRNYRPAERARAARAAQVQGIVAKDTTRCAPGRQSARSRRAAPRLQCRRCSRPSPTRSCSSGSTSGAAGRCGRTSTACTSTPTPATRSTRPRRTCTSRTTRASGTALC